MNVILAKDVAKLGAQGDVLTVKDGYARNYLFPKKLAYTATPANLKRIEQQRSKRQAELEAEKKESLALAEKIGKVSCTITVEVNDLDKLYGSVTEQDIAKVLEDEGFAIDKRAIVLENPIEELGIFEVGINLHPEVQAKLRVWVAKK